MGGNSMSAAAETTGSGEGEQDGAGGQRGDTEDRREHEAAAVSGDGIQGSRDQVPPSPTPSAPPPPAPPQLPNLAAAALQRLASGTSSRTAAHDESTDDFQPVKKKRRLNNETQDKEEKEEEDNSEVYAKNQVIFCLW